MSPAQVEAITGVSQRSIRRIVKEPEVTQSESLPSGQCPGAGRPTEVSQYTDEIAAWLSEARDPADGPMKSQEVLARASASERLHRG